MPVSHKEPSDELIPNALEVVSARRARRSGTDYLALAIATCGVGYLPIAPGTWGSLVGVALYLLVRTTTLRFIRSFAAPSNGFMLAVPSSLLIASELTLTTVVALLGVWAGTRAEKLLRQKDPGKVVIDEVAGQLIALLPAAVFFDPGWTSVILGFLLFRAFDIAKPYPIRRLESLESGLGIMADDILAGIYAATVLAIMIAIFLIVVN